MRLSARARTAVGYQPVGNESLHHAARLRDVDGGNGVGVRAGDEQALAVGAESQRAGRHAERLIGGHGDVDGFEAAHVVRTR